jgi:hypothetical protein
MKISKKTLENLRSLINEEIEYRSGPNLVEFFNNLGFKDTYGQGFPSRWAYTDEKLEKINGTPELDKCIKEIFNPINFIEQIDNLDKYIGDFNKYLAFDGWQVVRKNTEITFARKSSIDIDEQIKNMAVVEVNESDFLDREFQEINIERLNLDALLVTIINNRIAEIKQCMTAKAHLSVIFMCGSVLEGLLLSIESKYPKDFNQAQSAPKDASGKVKHFSDWTLNNSIDTACELGFLCEDVRKFSHALKDFRNYIHPYQQMSSQFMPDEHTAKICFQVLKAAIFQISQKINKRL